MARNCRDAGYRCQSHAGLNLKAAPSRAHQFPRRNRPYLASIQTGTFENECLQRRRVDRVALVEIDGTNRLAVQTRVEEALRILQLGTPDESPQLAQPLTPPAGHPADDVIYLLGRGSVAHADALLRLVSTQRTEGLSSLSLRWMQPSQQHGRRFPSSSSDCNRRMCWLLVSAFFGQTTQQIHSLRARGVRSCHAARTFGLAIKTRLKSTGTVCATPPETTWSPSIAHRSFDAVDGSVVLVADFG